MSIVAALKDLQMEPKNTRAEERLAWIRGWATEAPAHLSERAKELWREVCPMEVRSMERLAIVQAALEALDRADEAREHIAREGMTTITARSGVVHVHPLVKIDRESREQFAKLWKQSGVSDIEISVPSELNGSHTNRG